MLWALERCAFGFSKRRLGFARAASIDPFFATVALHREMMIALSLIAMLLVGFGFLNFSFVQLEGEIAKLAHPNRSIAHAWSSLLAVASSLLFVLYTLLLSVFFALRVHGFWLMLFRARLRLLERHWSAR